MKFSKDFLNKLLNSAINFHNSKIIGNKIPSKLNSIESALKHFNNAIEYEAKQAMQNEIIVDKPLLHAINLETTLAKETRNGNFDSRREEKRRSR